MNNSPENLGTQRSDESEITAVHVQLSPDHLFSALQHFADARTNKPQLCGLCVQDWAVAPSLLCKTCISVDAALAGLAGSQHFLAHVWSGTLQGQPQHVMTCTLHKLHYPEATGFYGVYTTMYRILAHKCRVNRANVRERATAGAAAAWDIATSLQPSRARALELISNVTSESFPVAKPWLDGVIDQVRSACEQQDTDSPVTLTDYERAQIAMALR